MIPLLKPRLGCEPQKHKRHRIPKPGALNRPVARGLGNAWQSGLTLPPLKGSGGRAPSVSTQRGR